MASLKLRCIMRCAWLKSSYREKAIQHLSIKKTIRFPLPYIFLKKSRD